MGRITVYKYKCDHCGFISESDGFMIRLRSITIGNVEHFPDEDYFYVCDGCCFGELCDKLAIHESMKGCL